VSASSLWCQEPFSVPGSDQPVWHSDLKSAKVGLGSARRPLPQSRKIREQTQSNPLGLKAYFSVGYTKILAIKPIEVNRVGFRCLARKDGRFLQNLDERGRLPNNECPRRFMVATKLAWRGGEGRSGWSSSLGRAPRSGQEQLGAKLESPLQSGGKETRLSQPSMNWAANESAFT
jgi:hypothetical protein